MTKQKKKSSNFATLEAVVDELKKNKRIVLYGFNGVGKTSLSVKFQQVVSQNYEQDPDDILGNIVYFNSYTEDLFAWEKDADEFFLRIKENRFIDYIINTQGKEPHIQEKLKNYLNSKLEPQFDLTNHKVRFRNIDANGNEVKNFKISRGEESLFIWSIFEVLLETIIEERLEVKNNSSKDFANIEYIFIDDPVSSLDENNIIEIAVNIRKLMVKAKDVDLNFIITTHHGLFYNILHHEFTKTRAFSKSYHYQLQKLPTGNFCLDEKKEKPFFYHLHLLKLIRTAIFTDSVEKYHFMLFRNLLEKTASFLGYSNWEDCLVIEGDNKESYTRVINNFCHNRVIELQQTELEIRYKNMLKNLFEKFEQHFHWNITSKGV